MSHPFGKRIHRYLSLKDSLTQATLADAIDQAASVVSLMCKGQRLTGPLARDRVLRIIKYFHREGLLSEMAQGDDLLAAADDLLAAANMLPLTPTLPSDQEVLELLKPADEPMAAAAFQAAADSGPQDAIGPDPTVAAALALLATLPLTTIPPPSITLPRGSFIPFPAHPMFAGRDAELRALAAMIKGAPPDAAAVSDSGSNPAEAALTTIAVTGMGGLGKTQLVTEFAYRYARYFAGGVFWINCAEPASIADQIAACGGLGHMELHPNFDQLPLETRVRAVLATWQQPIPRLLIFDGCDDPALLERWRPRWGGCRVLVTSRRQLMWSPTLGVREFRLQTLVPAASAELLRRWATDLAPDHAATIVAELGYLPLAILLAGSYLRLLGGSIDIQAYLRELHGDTVLKHPSLQESATAYGAITLTRLSFGAVPHDDPESQLDSRPLESMFQLSYRQLCDGDSCSDLARMILWRASYFASGVAIPVDLLSQSVYAPLVDKPRAYAKLHALGLLEYIDRDQVRLHRLLAEFIRELPPPPSARAEVEEVIFQAIAHAANTGSMVALLPFAAHVRAVTDRAWQQCLDHGLFDRAAGIQLQSDVYLMAWGDYDLIEERHARLQAHITRPRLSCLSLMALGNVHLARGKITQARHNFEQALAIAREHTNRQDEGVLLSLIGACSAATGAVEEAISLYQAALAVQESQDMRLLAKFRLHLSSYYLHLGQLDQARQQCVALHELVAAIEEPGTVEEIAALCAVTEGVCDSLEGATDSAIDRFTGALTIATERHHHRLRATCLGNLADCYVGKGNRQLVEDNVAAALDICATFDFQDQRGNVEHVYAEWLLDHKQYKEAIAHAQSAEHIGTNYNISRLISDGGCAQARAYLLAGDVPLALETLLRIQPYAVALNHHYMLLLLGIARLRLDQPEAAGECFRAAMEHADHLLHHAGKHFHALDTQWLAWCGLHVCCHAQPLEQARTVYQTARAYNRDTGLLARLKHLLSLIEQADSQNQLVTIRDLLERDLNR